MLVAQIKFEILEKQNTEKQSDAIYALLTSIARDGRFLDNEFCIYEKDDTFITTVKTPEKDAIKNLVKQKYIFENLKKLKEVGLSRPDFEILGEDAESSEPCKCKNHSAYILFTNFLSIQSPVKCYDCGLSVPLYRIKQKRAQQLSLALGWQSEYKACDLLQMQCGFGKRFGANQMSKLDSGLSKKGIEICQTIQQLTGKSCYYYLYRYNGKSLRKERERKCPSCGDKWFLDEQLLDIFDFRCDKCHLLSNIAFNLK